jgi:hypothetical protein
LHPTVTEDPEEVMQMTEAVEGTVPEKEVGCVNSTQVVVMVQPVVPQLLAGTGVGGGGGVTEPAPETVKPLKTKLDEEEQGTEEGHAAEPSSQLMLPLQTLQTGTIPDVKAEVIP